MRRRLMHYKRNRILVAIAALLVCCLVACGGGGGNGDQPKEESAAGQTVEVGDVAVTLNSAAITNYKLEANLTVANKGAQDLEFDPETAFAVEGSAGDREVPITLDTLACRGRLLKGTVPAGGELTGDVCWKADATKTWPALAKITYSGAPTAWEVKAE
jgi:hypothetical protein